MKNTETCVKSDIGLWRPNNEDRFLVIDDTSNDFDIHGLGKMFAIADGMGGHAAGEVASKMACEGMLTYYMMPLEKAEKETSPDTILANIETVIRRANKDIYNHGQRHRKCIGMGTTLSVLLLWQNYAVIGHVGDCRIYRLRGTSLEQLTVDHTEVQSLLDDGTITPAEATSHPFRHVLLQAVGVSEHLDNVMTRVEKIESGDIFLLSSDGLHDWVSDAEIQKTLTGHPASQPVCEALVKLALDKGGKDNITVVVVKVLEGD